METNNPMLPPPAHPQPQPQSQPPYHNGMGIPPPAGMGPGPGQGMNGHPHPNPQAQANGYPQQRLSAQPQPGPSTGLVNTNGNGNGNGIGNGTGNGNGLPPPQTPSMNPNQNKSPFFMSEQAERQILASMNKEKFNALLGKASALRQAGWTESTSSDLQSLMTVLRLVQAHFAKMQNDPSSHPNPSAPSPSSSSNPTANAPPPPPHVNMTPTQLEQLRTQVTAFQRLNTNQPLPPHLLKAVMGENAQVIVPVVEGVEQKVVEKTVEALGEVEKGRRESALAQAQAQSQAKMEVDGQAQGQGEKLEPREREYAMEYDESSEIFPYNAIQHDPYYFFDIKTKDKISFELSKLQTLIVPSIMPKGIDPYLAQEERERRIKERIEWRKRELEARKVDGGAVYGAKQVLNLTHEERRSGSPQMRQAIELLKLRLVDKQKLLREDMLRDVNAATRLPTERTDFRRMRTFAMRTAKETEDQEKKQKIEREQQSKNKHMQYIEGICNHGMALVDLARRNGDKARKLGGLVLKAHKDTEREEVKRREKIAKDRLKALKADDDDAYRALIDQAKDHRITHLLKRTDAYLESLTNQIDLQKRDVESGGLPRGKSQHDDHVLQMGDEGDEDEEGEKKKADYLKMTHSIKEKVEKQADLLVGGTLKSYQVQGLEWMVSLYNNKLNGILADEMGLGKTIQTISLITYLMEKKKEPGPFLVLVPLSTVTNWTSEFALWAPAVKIIVLKGDKQSRKALTNDVKDGNFHVLLTTFEFVIRESATLSRIRWHHMIIDEGHRMKNAKSKLSQTLNEKYSTKFRIILTGTPLQNNIPELWALLNFVLPKVFNSAKSFDEWFNAPFAGTGSEAAEMTEEEKLLVVKGLHKVLRPFLLRRLKKDVESELPDKTEKIIKVKMSALQQVMYKHMKEFGALIRDDGNSGAKSGGNTALQNMVIQLRKICQHPFVFGATERDIDPISAQQGGATDAVWRCAGKFELLDRILPKLFETGHKILIFFQWTSVMDIMVDYLHYKNIQHCRLDGHTKADVRQELLSTFNNENSPYKVFLLSTRAGGLGLNLQSSDTVIIFDSDYNPHADLQAQDRAHRIGQKKEVRVFRLVTSGSVEEGIIEVAKKKLALDGQVIQAGKFDGHTTADEREAFLRSLLERENEEDDEEAEPDEATLNEMLARGDHEMAIFTNMDAVRKAKEAAAGAPPRLMQTNELPAAYTRTYHKIDKVAQQEEQMAISGRGQRKRTEVNYADLGGDEDFLEVGEEDDEDDTAEQRQDKKRKRAAARPAAGDSLEGTPQPVERKGRGRKTKMSMMDMGDDAESVMSEDRPRKRGRETSPDGFDDDVKPAAKRSRKAIGEKVDAAVLMLYKNAQMEILDKLMKEPTAYIFRDKVPTDTPHYYELIKVPMYYTKIKNSVKAGRYKEMEKFISDVQTLWDNAKLYNQDGSEIYVIADNMEKMTNDLYAKKMAELNLDANKDDVGEDTDARGTAEPETSAAGSVAAGGGGPRLIMKFGRAASGNGTPRGGGVGGSARKATGRPRKVVKQQTPSDDEDDGDEQMSDGSDD